MARQDMNIWKRMYIIFMMVSSEQGIIQVIIKPICPTYELTFKNKDDEEVFTIGYFIEVVNLSVAGRYWDGNEDVMYGVEMKLPVKNE